MHAPTLLASALLVAASSASAVSTFTTLTSKVNGDDQFKIYISTQITTDGYQYANGWGWPITYTNTLWLPQPATNQNFKDYWLHIWVQDVGGGGPDLLGDFKLTGKPGCKFDNGTSAILTGAVNSSGAPYWSVTPGLPLTSGGLPVPGYPVPFLNYLPPFVQPTLAPADLGANGVAPWGPMPQINAAAHWISDPAVTNLSEAWFSAHIHCK